MLERPGGVKIICHVVITGLTISYWRATPALLMTKYLVGRKHPSGVLVAVKVPVTESIVKSFGAVDRVMTSKALTMLNPRISD